MDKRPHLMDRIFDSIAPTYDRANAVLSLSIDRLWRKITVRYLGIEEGDLVLDIATGTGDLALIALRNPGCSLVGIDHSRGMIKRAVQKGQAHVRSGRYCPVRGNALAMPFKDHTFSKAMVAFGIRNVQGLDELLDEMFRVIIPGGRAAVLEFSLPKNVLLRGFYRIYLMHIIPLVGGIISADFGAYKYLGNSVTQFHSPMALERIMTCRGFRVIRSKALFFGIAHLYILGK